MMISDPIGVSTRCHANPWLSTSKAPRLAVVESATNTQCLDTVDCEYTMSWVANSLRDLPVLTLLGCNSTAQLSWVQKPHCPSECGTTLSIDGARDAVSPARKRESMHPDAACGESETMLLMPVFDKAISKADRKLCNSIRLFSDKKHALQK